MKWIFIVFNSFIIILNYSQKNIKKRNLNNEANSPLFKDTKFLETIDDVYKRDFLKEINTSSELLIYDWSNGGEAELVVEDIEQIGEIH